MHVKNQIKALTAVCPTGIPVAEYERALRLVALVDEKPASQEQQQPPALPRQRHRGGSHHSASKEVVGQVAGLLATGMATAKELADTSGLHPASVYAALRDMGAVEVERRPRADGIGRGPAVWTLPKLRTP
jgi:hypothetical protein